MTLAWLAAGTMLVGLIIYVLSGGADFGGGIWDLLARGPRARAQREAIEHAIAPVWEANHVWLIFVIVVMFTAFPRAFAWIGTELHIPVTLLLIAIVLRGSAFVFRQYGDPRKQVRWGFVFAIASTSAAVFLGLVLGAITTGGTWYGPFPISVAILTLATFAFLAAVYLVVEVTEPELRADFRTRARAAGIVVLVAALGCALIARAEAPMFAHDLVSSSWSVPLIAATVVAAAACGWALQRGFDRMTRHAAIGLVLLLVTGWGLAHAPVIVAPHLTIATAAAPVPTLRALIPVILIGSIVLLPSLWWLMRVFKSPDRTRAKAAPAVRDERP